MKTIIKIIGIIALLLLVFDQSRSIYRFDDSHYITIWKRLGNKFIITFDKHYSICCFGIFNSKMQYHFLTRLQ